MITITIYYPLTCPPTPMLEELFLKHSSNRLIYQDIAVYRETYNCIPIKELFTYSEEESVGMKKQRTHKDIWIDEW